MASRAKLLSLAQLFSKCGLWTSSSGSTWDRLRNSPSRSHSRVSKGRGCEVGAAAFLKALRWCLPGVLEKLFVSLCFDVLHSPHPSLSSCPRLDSELNDLPGTYRHLWLGTGMDFRVGLYVCWFMFCFKQIWCLKLWSPLSVSKSKGEIHSERGRSWRVCLPLRRTVDSCVDSQDKIKDNRLSEGNVVILFLRV